MGRKALNLTMGKEVTDVQALMELLSSGKELNEMRQRAELE